MNVKNRLKKLEEHTNSDKIMVYTAILPEDDREACLRKHEEEIERFVHEGYFVFAYLQDFSGRGSVAPAAREDE